MYKYIFSAYLFVSLAIICPGQSKGPQIGTYPPQIHQQICQESTYTRFLNVFNEGDEALVFTASWSPAPVTWVSASPMEGQILPGDTLIVQFDFNSAGLPLDNYLVDYLISSNDPEYPEYPVLAMLHVQDLTILMDPNPDTVCSGCSSKLNTIVFGCSEAYTFAWVSNPPGFYSTEKSPVVNPEVTTTYTVTVTDGGYSKDESVQVVVPGTTGVKDDHEAKRISVFPNPGSGNFKVLLNNNIKNRIEEGENYQITVYNAAAVPVYTTRFILDQYTGELEIRDLGLPEGFYFLTLQSGTNSEIFVSKFLVN